MPGIVGLITKMPQELAEAELARMVESMVHEPFYETGTWIDQSAGIYVGWTAIKDSFSAGMPLCNERGNLALIFSGEEYSDARNDNDAHKLGNSTGANGSSHLLQLCENPNFPASLNGIFHGLLVDRSRGTATLFDDRYGMHRIYFHQSKDAFYFAAEAKAILAVRHELRVPDPQGLGEFVACGCVLENRTIFQGIRVLPPASAWVFRNRSLEQQGTYFRPREWEDQPSLQPEAYYQHLREVFSRNLPRYYNGQQPVGIALTGGLDTRALMAWHKSDPGSLPCYTFGGMFHESQDVQIARRIAGLYKQPYQVITVGDEFLNRFSHYAERSVYFSEGTVDVSRASDLYVSEKARKIAPVKVVGTYGSEILCRLTMFEPKSPQPGLFHSGFVPYIQQASSTYDALRREHAVTFAAFRQSPWYHHGVLAIERSQLTVRSPYLDNDFVQTVYRAPKVNNGANGDLRLRLIGDGDPDLLRVRSDRGVGGSSGPLAAMAVRNFLEFTFKAEYAYDYGMPQWLARLDHLISPLHAERLFLGRHKLTHFRTWYQNSLSRYVREMLLDPLTLQRPYTERKAIEETVHGHLKGNRNYTTEIHKLLTLELLHRLFFDGK